MPGLGTGSESCSNPKFERTSPPQRPLMDILVTDSVELSELGAIILIHGVKVHERHRGDQLDEVVLAGGVGLTCRVRV